MSGPHNSDPCSHQHGSDQEALDRCCMAGALNLARMAGGRTWPTPPVGCLIVRDGQVVGRGSHQGAGTPHAEPMALAEAQDRARGATLYVTLEPCNHQGRTPPCAPAVVEAGIKRVVVGMRDPNPGVRGGGCRFLRDHGVEVTCGVRADECLELTWPYVTTCNFTSVYVELKTAVSLDARFAPPTSRRDEPEPFYLTGQDARRDVHRRRRRVDLVLVGKGTAMADRPRLDGRLVAEQDAVPETEPLAGYVDTHLSWVGGLNRDSFLVFAGQSASGSPRRKLLEEQGAEIIFCRERDGRVSPESILQEAASRNLITVMIEGGPSLASAFLARDLVDRWLYYQAPLVLGQGVGWPDIQYPASLLGSKFSLTRTERHGRDLLAIYDKQDFKSMVSRVTI